MPGNSCSSHAGFVVNFRFRPVDSRPPSQGLTATTRRVHACSQGNYTQGPDDFDMHLVFFNTFEELKLPARSPMDDATTKLYEQSPTRILFCRLEQCAG